ncbi:MAG: hypothetical protein ACI9QD_000581 [Thermoproteota archaeon]|jgi:hypothetical protein
MKSTKQISLEAGKILIHENDTSRKLFILRKGRVRVYKTYLGGKITLAILGPGEIFGELSFFDSKPRSASVVAVTDIDVDCIDGDKLSDEIEGLPSWVHSVFKSVAARFRSLDQQMAVYQSLNNFKRSTLAPDATGTAIYLDLQRITKILKMILHKQGNSMEKDALTKELDQILGDSFINAKGYLKALFQHDFFDLNSDNKAVFHEKELDRLESFIKSSVDQEKFIVLGHAELDLILVIINSFTDGSPKETIQISKDLLNIINEGEDAFKQLRKLKVIIENNNLLEVNTSKMIDEFKYYSIVKSFDHTTIYDE